MSTRQRRPGGRWSALAVLLLMVIGACGPSSHDLEVVNNWDRGVVLYIVSERSGLPDQQVPLGNLPAGATQRFAVQVPGAADRVHVRYVYHSGIYEEHGDACIAADDLRQSAAWRLVIPTGPACR
jgi:hypothetical protein